MLKKLKNKKAPGYDGYQNEILKALDDNALHILCSIYNNMYQSGEVPIEWLKIIISPIFKKGEKSNPSNYRPISLIVTKLKLFTLILNERVRLWCMDKKEISDLQAAYKQNLGCIDHLFTLNTIICKSLKQKNGKLYCFFVDLSKAFDNIKHSTLWVKLNKLGLSQKFVNCVKTIYDNTKGCVKTSKGETNTFEITQGVLQGESLSPTLFILYMNDIVKIILEKKYDNIIINNMEIPLLLYADDIILIGTSRSNLQNKISVLKSYFEQNNFTINLGKSKIMIFKKSCKAKNEDILYWGKNKIEQVKEYKYLGVTISQTGLYNKATDEFVSKGLNAINASWPIFTRGKIPLSHVQLKLFNSLVKSVILYSSHVWSLRYIDKLERVQTNFFKKLLKLPKNTPDFFVRLEAGVSSISVSVIRQALVYWLKLVSSKKCSLLNNCYIETLKNTGVIEYNWKYQLSYVLGNSLKETVLFEKNPKILGIKLENALEKYAIECKNRDVEKMLSSNSMPFYKCIKKNINCEPYFNFDLPIKYACVFARLRANCENIYINNKKFSQNETCLFCKSNNVCDWYHIIVSCKKFKTERLRFINNIISPDLLRENWFEIINSNITKKNIIYLNNYFSHISLYIK
jgi:Reverse transcriptase (RNA-dependent DNA polymerase)